MFMYEVCLLGLHVGFVNSSPIDVNVIVVCQVTPTPESSCRSLWEEANSSVLEKASILHRSFSGDQVRGRLHHDVLLEPLISGSRCSVLLDRIAAGSMVGRHFVACLTPDEP